MQRVCLVRQHFPLCKASRKSSMPLTNPGQQGKNKEQQGAARGKGHAGTRQRMHTAYDARPRHAPHLAFAVHRATWCSVVGWLASRNLLHVSAQFCSQHGAGVGDRWRWWGFAPHSTALIGAMARHRPAAAHPALPLLTFAKSGWRGNHRTAYLRCGRPEHARSRVVPPPFALSHLPLSRT